MKFDIKKIGLTMILALVLVTILSTMLSQYSDIPVLKTGGAFVLLLISIFIIYFFISVSDGKIDKQEIWTMILVAVLLIGAGWALKSYFPQIFSSLPKPTRDIFSAIGI